MKRLMISAHPEWVEKILNGEKTIEVRPWIPKGELPLEVLIYVAKRKPYLAYDGGCYDDAWGMSQSFYRYSLFDTKCELDSRDDNFVENCPPLNGKVVAKFILNKAEEIIAFGDEEIIRKNRQILNMACLTPFQLNNYLKIDEANVFTRIVGYAWHIDDLEIFDEPKKLGEFYHYKKKLIDCGMDCPPYIDEVKVPLTKAPQKMVWVDD